MKGKRKKEKGKSAEFVTFLTYSLLLITSSFCLIPSAFALTRAEMVDRFRATPIVNTEGLIQVQANCPADMRREYQLPIAARAADICKTLYATDLQKPVRFARPGIVIVLGDRCDDVTNVLFRVHDYADGSPCAKILLPAPGRADGRAFATAVARAYCRVVRKTDVSDAQAWHTLITSSPDLRAADTASRLDAWSQRGVYEDGRDDEDYLKLASKVLLPGHLTSHERNHFASRLFLYPPAFDVPFCNRYSCLDLTTAIRERESDIRIRFAAFVKARQVLIFGAGRGPAMQDVAEAYAQFFTELGRAERTEGELLALLATAESKLKGVLE